MSLSSSFLSSRPALPLAWLFVVASMAVTSLVFGQEYQVKGYTPQPIPNAYQQLGRNITPNDAGLQLQVAPATGHRGQRTYAQPQFVSQPTQRSFLPSGAYHGNPAYQQLPASPRSKPAPVQNGGAQSYFPTDDAPMPYPSSSQFTGGQHSPKSSDHNPTLAADLVALRSNDRIQDSRLDHLERGQRVAPTPTVTEPVQTTRLTYEKHQVRARESIWGIADRYGVTAEDIRKTNSRRTDFITEGEILYIPQRVSASTNTLAGTQPRGKVKPIRSSKSTHIVQRGETLSTIAAAYGVSAKSLQSTNGIRNPNVIALGQKLAIPGSSNGARTAQPLATSAKPQRAAAPAPKAATAAVVVIAPEPLTPGSGTAIGSAVKPVGLRGITSYRVEVGDNVDSVAKTFGITPAELRRINRVDQLPPTGEEIAVPLPGSVAL